MDLKTLGVRFLLIFSCMAPISVFGLVPDIWGTINKPTKLLDSPKTGAKVLCTLAEKEVVHINKARSDGWVYINLPWKEATNSSVPLPHGHLKRQWTDDAHGWIKQSEYDPFAHTAVFGLATVMKSGYSVTKFTGLPSTNTNIRTLIFLDDTEWGHKALKLDPRIMHASVRQSEHLALLKYRFRDSGSYDLARYSVNGKLLWKLENEGAGYNFTVSPDSRYIVCVTPVYDASPGSQVRVRIMGEELKPIFEKVYGYQLILNFGSARDIQGIWTENSQEVSVKLRTSENKRFDLRINHVTGKDKLSPYEMQ